MQSVIGPGLLFSILLSKNEWKGAIQELGSVIEIDDSREQQPKTNKVTPTSCDW